MLKSDFVIHLRYTELKFIYSKRINSNTTMDKSSPPKIISCIALMMVICVLNKAMGIPVADRVKRVWRGVEATPNSLPWMGFLKAGGQECGTFLVNLGPENATSSDVSITAAHCLGHPSDMIVYFGEHNKWIDEGKELKVRVRKAIVHPEYYYFDDPDIALLILEMSVPFTASIRPVALANAPLDNNDNCSMSGWGHTETLKTLYFDEVKYDGQLYEAKGLNGLTIRGDSGSPLVCYNDVDNSYTAYGVSRTTTTYTDIKSNLLWIQTAYRERLYKYDSFLKVHDQLSGPSFSIEQTLVQHLSAIHGHMPEAFYSVLPSKENNTSSFLDKEYHKNYSGESGSFYSHDIIGYRSVHDAHSCVAMCLEERLTGPCSYIPSLKRCYISHTEFASSKILVLNKGQSLMISVGGKDKRAFKSESKIDLTPIGSVSGAINFNNLPIWSISINTKSNPAFHCTGHWVDALQISASRECLEILMQGRNLTIMNVNLLIVQQDRTIHTCDASFTMDNTSSPMVMIQKAKIPHDECTCDVYGKPIVDLPVTKTPKMYNYDPKSGIFVAKPGNFPWLVDIQLDEQKHCIGVLLNETDIAGHGRADRTRFVMTSNCYEKNSKFTKNVYIHAGSYFRNVDSPSKQSQKVAMHHEPVVNFIFDDEYSDMLVPPSSTYGGEPEILQLSGDILFNDVIKPLSLVSEWPKSFGGGRIFSAHWEKNLWDMAFTFVEARIYYARHQNQPQCIIPLSVEHDSSLDGTNTFIKTRRIIHYTEDIEHKSNDPLVYCNDIEGANQCQLLGFKSRVSNAKAGEEEHMNIMPYLPSIQYIIKHTSI